MRLVSGGTQIGTQGRIQYLRHRYFARRRNYWGEFNPSRKRREPWRPAVAEAVVPEYIGRSGTNLRRSDVKIRQEA